MKKLINRIASWLYLKTIAQSSDSIKESVETAFQERLDFAESLDNLHLRIDRLAERINSIERNVNTHNNQVTEIIDTLLTHNNTIGILRETIGSHVSNSQIHYIPTFNANANNPTLAGHDAEPTMTGTRNSSAASNHDYTSAIIRRIVDLSGNVYEAEASRIAATLAQHINQRMGEPGLAPEQLSETPIPSNNRPDDSGDRNIEPHL